MTKEDIRQAIVNLACKDDLTDSEWFEQLFYIIGNYFRN